MAGSRVPIQDLPAATTPPVGGLLVVQDGAVTKKMALDLVAGNDAALNAHINNPLDAHDATAVSTTAVGILTGPNVQSQLGQVASAIATDTNNLANHLADTVDAHDASAISATTASGFAGTDVQTQLGEARAQSNTNGTNLTAHISNASGAHAATAISASPGPGLTGTTVQAQLGSAGASLTFLSADLTDHLTKTVGAHNATAIAFTPTGTISATTVQAAILEVAAEAGGSGGGGGTIVSINGDAGPSVNLIASEIPFSPVGTIAASDTQAAVAEVATDAAAALLTHENDTTNIHGIANTASLVLTSDSRLSDARSPTAHAASHQNAGSDKLSLDGSQITTGVVVDARIDAAIARDTEVAAAIAVHTGQLSGAHAATAISFSPVGTIAGNTVQAAVAEVATDAATALSAHTGAGVGGAHSASQIAFTPTGTIAATNVQAALAEVAAEAGTGGGGSGTITSINGDSGPVVNLLAFEVPMSPLLWVNGTDVQGGFAAANNHIDTLKTADTNISGTINNHITNPSGAHAAAAISFSPTGTVAATTVQTAIAEVASEYTAAITGLSSTYQPLDSDLTSIAALTTTTYGRALLSLANQAALVALIPTTNDFTLGLTETATNAEAVTGTDTIRTVTPAGVAAAITNRISTKVDGLNGATGLWIGSQPQYDAIGTKNPAVVYIIS